jgi:hypothetical protein
VERAIYLYLPEIQELGTEAQQLERGQKGEGHKVTENQETDGHSRERQEAPDGRGQLWTWLRTEGRSGRLP